MQRINFKFARVLKITDQIWLQPPFDVTSHRFPEPIALNYSHSEELQAGDWVKIYPDKCHLEQVSKNSVDKTVLQPHQFQNQMKDPRRLKGVKTRSQIEAAIRKFFHNRNYLETRTPLLVKSPGMEPHIRPIQTTLGAYLPTSPEFAMKKLLAGGLTKIFQICPAFRHEPHSPNHLQEFTLLEWYCVGADENELMIETENLIHQVALDLFGSSKITFQEQTIDLTPPWSRFSTRELFQKYVGIDLNEFKTAESLEQVCANHNLLKLSAVNSNASNIIKDGANNNLAQKTWDDLYFLLWLNLVEPNLPKNHPLFVTEFPASQAALAKKAVSKDGWPYARRFEVFIGGLELANAFNELTDAQEQRARFVADMNLREEVYGKSFPKNPIDESFIDALNEGIPPTSGIALGVDRLIQLFADENEISYTFWLTPEESPASPQL